MLNIDILFSLLEKKNIKQSELSKATGISTGNISDWKKGKSFPSAEKLLLIADYLGCSTYSISNSQTTINGTQANVIHNAMGSDGLTDEFMKVFAELCFDDKVSVMQYVKDIKKSAAPQDGDRK